MNEDFNYGIFDDETAFKLRLSDSAKLRRSGELLALEAAEMFAQAAKRRGSLDDPFSLARALQASGDNRWINAPREEMESALLAKAWGVQPRSPGSSFFINETLSGRRALTAAGDGGGAVGTEVPAIGVPNAANNFLGLCTVIRPDGAAGDQQVPRFDSLPAVTIMSSETSTASDGTPAVSASALTPANLGCYVTSSRQWTLMTRGGAEAVARLITNALRVQAQQQIIEGSGSNGQVLGLVNDSTITSVAGTSITWATVCDALKAVEAAAGDAPLTWVCTSAAASVLRQRETAAGAGPILRDNRIAGYPVITIGGTGSAHAILGRWEDLLIHEWQPVEIQVNPFAIHKAGIIGTRGWLSFNAAPLVAASFYGLKSIT